VFAPDQAGRVWYGEGEGDIGEISAGGGVSETVAPGPVQGVTTGPDGATWFTYIDIANTRDAVGRLAPDGTVSTYPLPTVPGVGGNVGELVAAADGFLYARLVNEPYAVRISTTGSMTYLDLPGRSDDIIRGPDGAAWFSAWQNVDGEVIKGTIGRLGGSGVTEQHTYLADSFDAPEAFRGRPDKLAVGADGRIWFTTSALGSSGTYIGAMTRVGRFTFYKVAGVRENSYAIASGPNGNVWQLAGQVREIDTSGKVVAEHPLPQSALLNAGFGGLATGPDGRVWFNDGRDLYAMSTRGDVTTVHPPAGSPVVCWPSPRGAKHSGWVTAGGPLSVEGRALDRITSVSVGGVAADFRAVSPVQIDLTVPATLAPGRTTLEGTDGTTSTTLPGGVTVAGQPTITGLSPSCGSTAGGDRIVIHGTDLASATSATVDGQPAVVDEDPGQEPTETSVAITTPMHLAPGIVDVGVTTIGGTSEIVPADRFTYSPACT